MDKGKRPADFLVRRKDRNLLQRRREVLEYFGVDERMIKYYNVQRDKVTKAFRERKISKEEWQAEQDKINEEEDKILQEREDAEDAQAAMETEARRKREDEEWDKESPAVDLSSF